VEAAFAVGQNSAIQKAQEGLARFYPVENRIREHALGRLALLEERFDHALAVYGGLVAEAQAGANHHYFFALSLLRKGSDVSRAERAEARDHLRLAVEMARWQGERERYQRALQALERGR